MCIDWGAKDDEKLLSDSCAPKKKVRRRETLLASASCRKLFLVEKAVSKTYTPSFFSSELLLINGPIIACSPFPPLTSLPPLPLFRFLHTHTHTHRFPAHSARMDISLKKKNPREGVENEQSTMNLRKSFGEMGGGLERAIKT